MARRNRKGISVDLSNVEVGGKALPEGNYNVEVADVECKQSSNGNDMLAFTFQVTGGTYKGSKLYHNCSLQPQALFNLKGILLALGYEIPKKAFDLQTSELVGLTCEVEVSHEVYEGKKKARITDFISTEDSEGGDDGDESEDDEITTEDLEDLDKDELKELAKAVGIKAKALKKLKSEEDLIEAITGEDGWEDKYDELFGEEDEDDEESDSDEEEEDEVDYDEMSVKELKAEARERGLKVTKGMDKDALVEMLEEDDEE
jgi:hypothetical protein